MRDARALQRFGWLVAAVVSVCLVTGCSRLRPAVSTHYVYVTAKQTFLRDRLAAVSNRTGTVENGQRVELLERSRRYVKVKTDKGEVGWLEEKAVAAQDVYDQFQSLGEGHKTDAPVASAVVRDEVVLHLKPGRDAERFYRLAEGDKLQLLARATLPKPLPGGAAPAKAADGPEPAPIAMEDWWLVRDAKGRAGWILSRMMEVDAPETLTRYAEGQKFIGAYVLTTVHDDGIEGDVKEVPIFLAVMGPYTAGLPYDFDQVRVFTWSLKMHRYETAFREKNIEGYLPVSIKMEKDPWGKSAVAQTPAPTFGYRVLAADAAPVVPDPVTGMVTPSKTVQRTFRLEGTLVRRVAAPGVKDEGIAHPVVVEKKAKGKKK